MKLLLDLIFFINKNNINYNKPIIKTEDTRLNHHA